MPQLLYLILISAVKSARRKSSLINCVSANSQPLNCAFCKLQSSKLEFKISFVVKLKLGSSIPIKLLYLRRLLVNRSITSEYLSMTSSPQLIPIRLHCSNCRLRPAEKVVVTFAIVQ